MKRKDLRSIYQERYSEISAVQLECVGRCYYCGDTAEVKDHYPPLSTADCFSVEDDIDWLLVPSCSECNLLAGSEPHNTLEERREYIQEKLKSRYKKELRLGEHWYDAELEEVLNENPTSTLFRDMTHMKAKGSWLKGRVSFEGYGFDKL